MPNIKKSSPFFGIDENHFWERVQKNESGCWPWLFAKCSGGYGTLWNKNKALTSHRVAWALTFGDPGKMHVMHVCDNPICCNPSHMAIGTHADNMADMYAKKRRMAASGIRSGRYTKPERTARGEGSGRSKLTEYKVREIRKLRANGVTLIAIASLYGVCFSNIARIVNLQSWIHVK